MPAKKQPASSAAVTVRERPKKAARAKKPAVAERQTAKPKAAKAAKPKKESAAPAKPSSAKSASAKPKSPKAAAGAKPADAPVAKRATVTPPAPQAKAPRKYGLIDLGPAATAPPVAFAQQAIRFPGSSAKSVGSFLPKLTKAAFEKNGFSTVTLLTQWREIAGPAFADAAEPERLVWPRSAPGGDGASRGAATLVLSVDPARALDVQYGAVQLVERINGFFGYRAVDKLRLEQAPHRFGDEPEKAASPRLPLVAPVPREVTAIADAGLRDALARLSMSVMSRSYA